MAGDLKNSSLRPHGHIFITDPDGRETGLDCHQCCHCDAHFAIVKGSGKIRGFCTRCMQSTCGRPECHECVPFEKKLEQVEAGKRFLL